MEKGKTKECRAHDGDRPNDGSPSRRRHKDLVGQEFGRLTVTAYAGRRNQRHQWKCLCSCGRETTVEQSNLLRGNTRSCGCLTHSPVLDLTGQQFGRLTAQSYAGKRNGRHCWACRCACGNTAIVYQAKLVNHSVKSCGCLAHPGVKDYVGKRFGRLTVTAYAGKRGDDHLWQCRCDCGRICVATQDHIQRGLTKSCGCLHDTIYRENLKLVAGTSVTKLETRRGKLNARNTSGYNGVYPQMKGKVKTGRWVAQIGFRGKKYFLGSFERIEDAAQARQEAERRMYDGFLNWYYEEYLPEHRVVRGRSDG